ncbi:MAG: site-specific tyrosine recombinase XerD [Clostridium sp.]|uniref:site-specific tyrosine recombinase XerD n=1 Tax=Clostridium sp. TaxID=1506 RepID=UPI002A8F3814|nr:site-specific tyrosine recombinase XerD [Clostridium sp.]MDY5098230.1 site-specific tyrosine recombinase XerD [Clostridium sp.]
MEDIVLGYITYLKKKKLSESTIESYKRDLNKYVSFIKDRDENLKEADEITIMAFIQSLLREKISNSSINRNVVTIRGFYKYLYKKGIINSSPVISYELPKVERNLPEILTIEEVDKLLSMPDLNSEKGIRDKAMLELMYATGMKVTELINLTIFDINLKMNYIKCKGTKEKERVIPLGSVAIRCIEKYLESRNLYAVADNNLLFFNSRGYKMTRQGFWKIVKGYVDEAHLDKHVNLYTLRHSFAVHLLENGADIKSVQELLGHVDLSATQIYSTITKKNKLAEVYKNAHPRA